MLPTQEARERCGTQTFVLAQLARQRHNDVRGSQAMKSKIEASAWKNLPGHRDRLIHSPIVDEAHDRSTALAPGLFLVVIGSIFENQNRSLNSGFSRFFYSLFHNDRCGHAEWYLRSSRNRQLHRSSGRSVCQRRVCLFPIHHPRRLRCGCCRLRSQITYRRASFDHGFFIAVRIVGNGDSDVRLETFVRINGVGFGNFHRHRTMKRTRVQNPWCNLRRIHLERRGSLGSKEP